MTDRPLEFIFGLHFHQPVGNFKWVLENAYTQAYRPLIDAFKKYENLKLSLHISSPLLEFFKKEHPDFLQDICREIEKEKIEMLGGCFYEPILVSIPRRDILGQLKKTEHFLSDYMNTSSRGIWLAERVWEPHIPSLLKDSGAEYLAVDDTHFIQAGFTPSKLKGYYMSEDAGNKLGVFIINKELRYYIPFKPVDEIMDKFRDFSNRYDNPLLGMLDDGEKFGFWPKTKEWVHGQGWLDKFFKALNENSSWLKMRTLSEYYDKNRPLGRAYLPACQYYEMLEWAMPVEGSLKVKALKEKLDEAGMLNETDPYITGGMWKNFFHKYPESNYANKKMLYLSSLLHENKNAFTDSQEFEEARDCLYRSQCNCAYWHGVFGGIYLPHLRRAIHSNLIKVSSILDKILYEEKFCNYSLFDIDCDGSDEILVNTDSLFLCFSPSKGG
ncbi:MAG: alpha-amylase/4-alpha-glucanotransferase domain-containing protein, partial [Elusimicrobiota bacterium]